MVLHDRAEPALVRRWRHAVGDWVEDAGGDPALVEKIVLAVNEALNNAVEHAYRALPPGEVRLHARGVVPDADEAGGARLVVEISDRGRWQPPAPDPGFRGRGLMLIDALADHVDLTHSTLDPETGGTTITMTWWGFENPSE